MGIFTKLAAAVIGTRIAADTGKAGMLGAAAGVVATRVIARSPMGALLVGGAYIGHKLWQKKKEIDAKGPHATAVADGIVTPGERPLEEIEAGAPRVKASPATS